MCDFFFSVCGGGGIQIAFIVGYSCGLWYCLNYIGLYRIWDKKRVGERMNILVSLHLCLAVGSTVQHWLESS